MFSTANEYIFHTSLKKYFGDLDLNLSWKRVGLIITQIQLPPSYYYPSYRPDKRVARAELLYKFNSVSRQKLPRRSIYSIIK